jgi:hypothetical protein
VGSLRNDQRRTIAQRVDAVEAAVEQHYRTIAITDADRERVQAAIEQKLSAMTEGRRPGA